MSDKKDLVKENDLEFNKFVATEEDLRAITDTDVPTIDNPPKEVQTANKDGSPVEQVALETLPATIAPKKDSHDEEVETDYNYIRTNLYTITERSVEALNDLSQIAGQSQHPRAYEVLSLLVKTIADAQKDLMSIHKEKVKIDAQKAEQHSLQNPEVVNNNLFVGTTAQLDEIIAKMTKKKDA